MTRWRKSTFSDNNGCIEVAHVGGGLVGLRDDKLGDDSPVLTFTRGELAAWILGCKAGEFDDLL